MQGTQWDTGSQSCTCTQGQGDEEEVNQPSAGSKAVTSNAGKRYMLNLIDDFTSFSWNYTRNLMPKLYSKSGKHTLKLKIKISIFCTDSSGEYTSADFQDITM